ncbi:hypothetical protein J6TS1_02400 [Siminovitchia terrae]|uniref:Transposase n=1 Tax=Siminovitchia terrae TaxID=1914933 RepID=A0ABQ4KQV0_SIMTE|nr:hypothetical protein J6TS1_02400 [Siminovitchia terrae]
MSSDKNSLAHTKWNYKYHIVFIEINQLWKTKTRYRTNITAIV